MATSPTPVAPQVAADRMRNAVTPQASQSAPVFGTHAQAMRRNPASMGAVPLPVLRSPADAAGLTG